jgi:Tol biopolymer transport system component
MSARRRPLSALLGVAGLLLAGLLLFVIAIASSQGRAGAAVSVAAWVPANGNSDDPYISADGRFVCFDSTASNLVPGDTNGRRDVFVRDRVTGTTERVSVSSGGAQANGHSFCDGISADGRFVLFESIASNLVPGDTNGSWDVFVRDRLTGTTERVSLTPAGAQGEGYSYNGSISADGRFVAFDSEADNFIPPTGNSRDEFVRDRLNGTTVPVDVNSAGKQANGAGWISDISGDGRFIVFSSYASNLVSRDTNRNQDVFVRDQLSGTTERVSVSSAGAQANGSSDLGAISANGRFVAFNSTASNLVRGDTNGTFDVFVHDQLTGKTTRVSISTAGKQGNGSSNAPELSDDGRFVAFDSTASNLVAGDTNGKRDVFVHDRRTGRTERVSVSSAGRQANGKSFLYSISADGRFVAFVSNASNLVPGDKNGTFDVFVRDRVTGKTELISGAQPGH